MDLKIFCDGGARGNPGPAAAAFIVKDAAGNLLEKCGKYLGPATNNVAEYSAVIAALTFLSRHPELVSGSLNFFLDSQLVVSQLNGLYKVKNPRLRELLVAIRSLETGLTIRYSYIPRSQNFLADSLVNATLDSFTG